MPPEALEQNSRYGTSIDIFSFGHLALFTITQDFPFPTEPILMDPDNPGRLIPRSEVERRSAQMGQLSRQLGGERCPLVQLITQCLHNNPEERPLASEIMSELQQIRSQIVDEYQYMSKVEMINLLRTREAEAIQVSYLSKYQANNNNIPLLTTGTPTGGVEPSCPGNATGVLPLHVVCLNFGHSIPYTRYLGACISAYYLLSLHTNLCILFMIRDHITILSASEHFFLIFMVPVTINYAPT